MSEANVFPMKVAAIDVGSNAIRFVAAEFHDPHTYTVIEAQRAAVRLGGSVFRTGDLDAERADAALAALAGFAQRIDQLGIRHVRAVATSAVRESRQSKSFAKRARRAGIPLEVISGAEEARLVHLAVREAVELGDQTWLLMDLGGGSIEIAVVDRAGIRWSESRPHGSVRLLDEHASAGERDGEAARHIHARLDGFRLLHANDVPLAGMVATGGNINYLAKQVGSKASEDEQRDCAVPVKAIAQLVSTMEPLAPSERRAKYGMRSDRADVVVPAGLAYLRVAQLVGAQEIHVPGCGLKEGVLLDLVEGLSDPGAHAAHLEASAEDAALALGRALGFDEDHATHVARLSLRLFDELATLHRLDANSHRILHIAGLLHDVGRVISDAKHHKHSAYLIRNAQLPGLSPSEVEQAALVARYHRKARPKRTHAAYAALPKTDRRRVRRLAALLRVAESLDQEHRGLVADVQATDDGTTVTLHLVATPQRAGLELERWALRRRAPLFERVFDRRIIVQTELLKHP